jgi:anti-anti-sigma regulatory factor
MTTATVPHVVCDRPNPHVRVVRFVRPDLREVLYDAEPITSSSLFQEIRAAVNLDALPTDDALVVNLGLVEWLPSVFFRLLMELRAAAQRRQAKLILCCLQPGLRESFDLMGGSKLFEVRATEARAVADGSA